MKRVVFDCDNTMGMAGCDVDDGLALMYLLGCREVQLEAVTATYGNNKTELVYDNICRMLADLNRTDIPVKRGGLCAGDAQSEASAYLAELAKKHPGELSILATGSLTNLWGAWQTDPDFFRNLKEIVLMGGITEPLVFEKKIMDELNFSCDPRASFAVLTQGPRVSVITGNNCLKVLFTKEEYKECLEGRPEASARYILKETDYWFDFNRQDYGIQGFYNWDVTAAVYLVHPELFTDCPGAFAFSEKDLKTGFLRRTKEGGAWCNLPEIGPEDAFKKEIYRSWLQVDTI